MKIHKLTTNTLKSVMAGIAVMTSAISFTSCSDDISFRDVINQEFSEGQIYVDFNVQDISYLRTRSSLDNESEQKINNLTILIFSSDGNTLLQRTEVPEEHIQGINRASASENRRYTGYVMELNQAVKLSSSAKLYAIANNKSTSSDLIEDFKTGPNMKESDLKGILHNSHYTTNNNAHGWLMSDRTDITTTNTISIALKRTTGKITVKDDSPKVEGTSSNLFEFKGFTAKKTADKCYLVAGTMSYPNYFYTTTTREVKADRVDDNNGSYRYDAYVFPTKTHEDQEKTINTYVLIEGTYQGVKNYYALALYKKEKESGTETYTESYYDIEPNHWYEIVINEVKGPGYADPNEAARNILTDQVVYEIHDHAPKVLSMMSDGVHELGVTPEVTISATDKQGSTTFDVKCYSVKDDLNVEESSPFKVAGLTVEMQSGEDWLDLIDEIEDVGSNDEGVDKDTPGVQLRFTVKTNRNIYSDRKATFLVSWKGLTRTVTVFYDSTIDMDRLCPVTLNIYKNGYDSDLNPISIQDYWTFVRGKGTNYSSETSSGTQPSNTPALFGTINLSNGNVRSEGLHFPMPYGDDLSTPWEYEYILDFENASEYTFDSEGQVDIENKTIENDYFNKLDLKRTSKGVIQVRFTSPTDDFGYDYELGSLDLKVPIVENNQKRTIYVTLPLYHTGFFHFTNDSKYGFTVADKTAGYYYYEVVPMGRDENLKTIYWLDRNIGAKSNKSYVRNEGTNFNGEKEAAGTYLTIANVVDNYSPPSINYDMCPPGYTIPSTSEWNVLRLSSNFTTQIRTVNEQTYMASFYDTYDENIGEIYFPKARFYNGPNSNDTKYAKEPNAGDPASGYYWNTTESPGMEKENMGNWLRSMYFNGASSNFNNSSVKDYKLPLRCIANNRKNTNYTNHYLSFNVHNVTHVFLFSYLPDGTVNQLYNFPGKPVGTAASASVWQNFACITSANLDNLYAVFVKVSSDGSPTIYYRTGEKFTSSNRFSTDYLYPEDSWQVQQGYYYDFCEGSIGSKNVEDDSQPSTCMGNGYVGGKSGEISDSFNGNDEIIFRWPTTIKGVKYPRISAFYWDNEDTNDDKNKDLTGEGVAWSGKFEGTEDKGMYEYKYTGLKSNIGNGFNIRVCKNAQDYEGIDFSIKYNIVYKYYFITHQTLSTSGGKIERTPNSSGGYTWTITLYDFDGIEAPESNFTPDDRNEEIIWQGDFYLNGWSGSNKLYDSNIKDYDNSFSWNNYNGNIILKVYTTASNDNKFQVFSIDSNGGWKQIGGDYEPISKNDSNLEVIKVPISSQQLNDLKNGQGIVIQGVNCNLIALTIMPDDGTGDSNEGGGSSSGNTKYTPKNPNKENEIWSDYLPLNNWSAWQDLAYSGYNWSSEKAGSSIRIYTESTGTSPGIQVFYVDGEWQWYSKIEPIVDGFVEIPITTDFLQKLSKPNGGLVLQGYQIVLLGVTIYTP